MSSPPWAGRTPSPRACALQRDSCEIILKDLLTSEWSAASEDGEEQERGPGDFAQVQREGRDRSRRETLTGQNGSTPQPAAGGRARTRTPQERQLPMKAESFKD